MLTGYPRAEEWGWFLDFLPESGQEVAIGCASHGSTMGFPTEWRVFARQKRKPIKGGEDASQKLHDAVLSVLAAEGIEARKL